MAWYKDETEAGGGVGGSEVEGSPGADGILSPLGKMGLVTPEKPAGKARGKRKGRPATVKEEPSQEAAGEGVTSPFGKLALHTPQKVNLRPRSGQQDPAAAQVGPPVHLLPIIILCWEKSGSRNLASSAKSIVIKPGPEI